jgi:hypothetical protein
MIFKMPLYFEIEGGINPQNSREVIDFLTTVFEDFVGETLGGKGTKDPFNPKVTLKKEIALSKSIKEGFESFVGKEGKVTWLRRDEAKKKLLSDLK